jgi:peptidoglycan/LPS O-acetylase OafA/YrhL
LLANSTVTLLAPAWSISLEWQYYLVAPFLARFVRSGARLLLLTFIALLCLRYGNEWRNPHLAFLPAQLPLFLIGIGSYHLFARFSNSEHQRSGVFAIPIAAILAIAVFPLLLPHRIALITWALGFGCIFVRGNDLFSRLLTTLRSILLHPILQHLGKISYPLYLVHYPLIIAQLAALLYWRPDISSSHAALFLVCFGLPLTLVTANILHKLVELPLMSFGKRLNSRI